MHFIACVHVKEEEAQTIGRATAIENRLKYPPIMKTCALRLREWLVPGMELTKLTKGFATNEPSR